MNEQEKLRQATVAIKKVKEIILELTQLRDELEEKLGQDFGLYQAQALMELTHRDLVIHVYEQRFGEIEFETDKVRDQLRALGFQGAVKCLSELRNKTERSDLNLLIDQLEENITLITG